MTSRSLMVFALLAAAACGGKKPAEAPAPAPAPAPIDSTAIKARMRQDSINAADCDLVLVGTPIDLGALLKINKPYLRVTYELDTVSIAALKTEIQKVVK